MNDIIAKIRRELKDSIDLEYKKGSYRFFKEEIKLYGVQVPIVRNISKIYYSEIKNLEKIEIISLCDELLKSGYTEESVIAFDWMYRIRNQYEKNDFKIFESWVKKYISDWGRCDDFCVHAFGYYIYQFSGLLPEIEKWAKSKNRWQRRASAVCLIYSLRKKKYLKNSFLIADILLEDSDDLVQKGYGWMLKEVSNVYQNEVYNFVNNNKEKMPRTALRYAIEKMPKKMKLELMKNNK
ncbi:MAG: DNA alkylation repair protein [Candidatus Pacebacteria bacterium]|nr:DNA alkylation repair protein [Candidatus Paceibacterota bacterium]